MRSEAVRSLAPLALLSLLVTTPALAQPRLAWDDCGAAGVTDKAFACDVNTGEEHLYGSVAVPGGLTRLAGQESTLDMVTASTELPAWWYAVPIAGFCRPTGFRVDFTTACASAFDYLGSLPGGVVGGWGYVVGHGGTNRVRIRMVSACDVASAGSPGPAGTEMFLFRIVLTHAKSTGIGACEGCTVPACIVYTQLRLPQADNLPAYDDESPTPAYATWQGGAVAHGGCPAATPARASTWGQVKSLYR